MHTLKRLALAGAVLASLSTPAHAFFDELVIGMTSVTNNLIDSTESVTNNSVNAASNAFQTVASNPGKMADRIGVMADRIGFMADRIVTTEGIMAGLAHKIIDANQVNNPHAYATPASYQPRPSQYSAATYHAPVASPTPMPAYSASSMIYGVQGATYTAATPLTVSSYASRAPLQSQGYAANFLKTNVAEHSRCSSSYGVPLRC